MASLADTPDLVGFFSYSREDDEGSGGRLSKLREGIQEELRAQLGRTRGDFRLWQDKVSISHGELWEDNIKKAVSESVFFIPIITPTAVRSRYCKFEFETFLAREKELGRSNLVFPILYIPVPALTGDRWREDPLLAIIGSRQYEQWQNLRHLDAASTEVALRVEKLCENISKALQQPWVSPQERQEAEARRVAEDERRRQEKLEQDAQRVAEKEHRRQEAEAKRRLEEAEVEKRRQDNERRKQENEAAWAAKKARALQLLRGKTAAGVAVVVLFLVGGIWLYQTTIPAGLTSAVVQPKKQTAENAMAQGKDETAKPAGVTTVTAQSDKQKAGNTKEDDAMQLANQIAQESEADQLKKRLLQQTLENVDKLRNEMMSNAANNLVTLDDEAKIETTLSLKLATLSDDLRRRYNIKDTIDGVVITGVEANSSAAKQGLLPGYVISATYSDLKAEINRQQSQGKKFVILGFSRPDGRAGFATVSFPKNAP